jgi:ABC-type phosphate transport system substrate-binding protein
MLSFGRRKTARAGIRAALMAGAAIAVVGLSAGSAAASPSCTGSNITGRGSSLQKIAEQNVWSPNFHSNICNSGTEPTVTYESTGSGAGLEKWNHNGVEGKINTAYSFIGTDDAPTVAQIGNIDSVAGGAKLLTIPVAQTAISVIANPPAGCKISAIPNKDLESVFNGSILKWSQLSTVLATPNPACNYAIKRVVRADGSGTTYQFKNYLWLLNKKGLPCTTGATEGKSSWQELETNGVGSHPNIDWPEDEGCAVPRSPVLRASGGGGVAEKVIAESGSIGYASLPDAKSKLKACELTETCKNSEILSVQSNGKKKLSEATYASPQTGSQANCATAQYTVPIGARVAKTHTALDVDWSQVFGAKIDTTLTGGGYPLCTLTYALAFNEYSKPSFSEGQETTVKDYLTEYITATAGQEDIASNFYAPLPTGAASHNVLQAAQFTAGKIGF